MHDKLNVWSCCQCCSGPFAWSLYSACLHCQHFPCEACDFYYTPEYEEIKSTQTQLTLNENVGPKEDKRHKPKIDHEELDETRRSSLEIEDKMHALDLGDAQDTKSSPSPKLLRTEEGDLRASDPSLSSSSLKPLLDPVGHYENLRDLEEQVVCECRLQEYAYGGSYVLMESRVYNLETCVEDFQGLSRAIDLLTKGGFCEDYITLLVQTSTSRPNVADAIESDIIKLQELINGILKHASHLRALTDQDHTSALDATTLSWCYKIVFHLDRLLQSGINGEGEDSDNDSFGGSEPEHYNFFPVSKDFRRRGGASPSKAPSGEKTDTVGNFLYWCKCFHSVLALALSSYAGSHVSNFSQSLRQAGYRSFFINLNLAFQQRPLACLQRYLGSPAWIFGPLTMVGEFQVAISVKAFADLWGPIWTVPAESPRHIRHICTERGFLQQTSSLGDVRGAEIPCHWFAASAGFNGTVVPESQEFLKPSRSNTSPEAPHSATSFSLPIPENSRLLIGTPTGSTQGNRNSTCVALAASRSSSQGEAPHGMTVHKSCCVDIRKSIDFSTLQLAGVREETYANDSYSFSIVGGKYVTFGASKTRKRIPATKYKDQLIEWLSKPNTKERIVPLLEIHAGLEVSICTGNARRITLWEALRLASTLKRSLDPPEPANSTDMACAHHVGDTNCLINCWNSGSSSSINIGEWEQRDDYWRTVANALVLLNHTGVDNRGSLRAYWPYRSVPHTFPIKLECPKTKNYWIPIIADSLFTATFATMTPRCLRYRARDVITMGIYANECPSTQISAKSQDTTPARTALQTRIHLSPGILNSASMTRPIKVKGTHSAHKKPKNWEQNENTLKFTVPIKCEESLVGCNVPLPGKGMLRIRSDDNPRLVLYSEKALFSPKPFQKQEGFQIKELMYEDHREEQETISVLVI